MPSRFLPRLDFADFRRKCRIMLCGLRRIHPQPAHIIIGIIIVKRFCTIIVVFFRIRIREGPGEPYIIKTGTQSFLFIIGLKQTPLFRQYIYIECNFPIRQIMTIGSPPSDSVFFIYSHNVLIGR